MTARYSRPVRIALACALLPLLFPVRALAQSDCAPLDEVHLVGVVDGAPVRLYLRAGYDTPDTPDAGSRPGPREIERFNNFGNSQWWYGDCEGTADDATSLRCARTRQSTRLGMTVLQGAAGENRRYRPYGGYMGQGEPALNYLFLFSGRWVHVQESDGDDAPDFEKPGAVVFNGDSVVRRLVRSVRPVTP